MNLGPSADIPFEDHNGFLDFLGRNEVAHSGYAQALAARGYEVSAPQPLGDPRETPDWLNDHYQRHIDECSSLNIAVPDLSSVDLKQKDQYLDWMLLHAELHDLQNLALGITS